MEPLVSIIIAVYNGEETLPRCLDSVLGQTHRNLEVIIINDCSTDGTQDILEDYSGRDSRIVLLKTEKNSGAHVARNKGMAISRGEFMSSVDADDAIAPDAIESAVRDMQEDSEVDMVLYDVECTDNEGNSKAFSINPSVPQLMTGNEACYWSMQWDIPGWGVSRSPLEQSIPAETEYGQYGDETATHLALLKARKVKLGRGKYYYYYTPTSYTRKVSYKRFEILECRISLRQHLIEAGVQSKTIRRFDIRRWREFIGVCYIYWKFRETFTPEQCRNIKDRLERAYSTFHIKDLPLSESLKPRFAMLPGFRLFYLQLSVVFRLGLMHISQD